MDDAALKPVRQLLRRVQEHLFLAQTDLGARRESLGLIELVYHPGNAVPDLNYITPRSKTAWIGGTIIEQGLHHLIALDRTPCVRYIESLYPPLFARTLCEFGLEVQQETPLVLYKAGGIASLGVLPPAPEPVSAHEDIRVERVQDQRGAERWWDLWRSGLYDVITPGMEPLIRWRDSAAHCGQLIDVIIYRHKSLAGVARVSLQPENRSSHIVALALLQEARSPELTLLLIRVALQRSMAHGCDLVFAPGETDDLRRLYRALGFIDVGGIVTYVQRTELPREGNDDGVVEQPVLTLP